MRAAILKRSGPPERLTLSELERPDPGPGEILVRVEYASVSRGDVMMRTIPRFVLSVIGAFVGFRPMRVPGVEFAGAVESVGAGVSAFAPGDAVCGTTTGRRDGANADYVVVPVDGRHNVVVKRPEGLDARTAVASTVGAMTAMQILGRAAPQPGERVLVYGASGAVGTFALQLARQRGCEVTAVASGARRELLRSLGAAHVLDYATDAVWDGPARYDVIVDAVGKVSRGRCGAALAPGGRFVSVRPPTRERADELSHVLDLVASGEVSAVIDREYPLDDIVEAHRYVEAGHKAGAVVVRPHR